MPTISVSVQFSGASPTVMRDTIVRPIEDAIAGTPDLQNLSSNIQSGRATISAAFYITSDVNTDLVNVQKSLQAAQHQLPTTLQAPTVNVRDPSRIDGGDALDDVLEAQREPALADREQPGRPVHLADPRHLVRLGRRRRHARVRGRRRSAEARRGEPDAQRSHHHDRVEQHARRRRYRLRPRPPDRDRHPRRHLPAAVDLVLADRRAGVEREQREHEDLGEPHRRNRHDEPVDLGAAGAPHRRRRYRLRQLRAARDERVGQRDQRRLPLGPEGLDRLRGDRVRQRDRRAAADPRAVPRRHVRRR